MRFMQFRAHDKYALHLSKMEKVNNIIGVTKYVGGVDENLFTASSPFIYR